MKYCFLLTLYLIGTYNPAIAQRAFEVPEQGIAVDMSKASAAEPGSRRQVALLNELEELRCILAKELQVVMYTMGPTSSLDQEAVCLEFRRQNLSRYARIRAIELELRAEKKPKHKEANLRADSETTLGVDSRQGALLLVREETITDQAIRIEREYQDKLEAKLAEALLLNANRIQ